jgi:hypothetical protein
MSDKGSTSGDDMDGIDGPRRSIPGPRWRGMVIVVVAVIIGILLLPSATRAPLPVAASSLASSSSTTLTPPSSSTGTTTTTSALPSPPEVHVLVANATSVNHVATAVTAFLGTKGFSTLTATNATDKLIATQIYAVGGATTAAEEVASALSLPAATIQPDTMPVPVVSDAGATVVVVAGPDLAARFAPTTTTTTAG